MKVLVTYFTQTGNTEKVARAICEEASQGHEVVLKKLEEIVPEDLPGYDFIFVGSPLHSSELAAPVRECLGLLPAGPNRKLAGFITHFAPAYPEQAMDGFTEPLKKACKEKNIEYKGCFDCQGALVESLHGPVRQKLGLSDEAWADMVKQMTGHPDEKDLADAKACARAVLA